MIKSRVKKIINRHMQSISLLAIAGILLGGAFIISQQIRSPEGRTRSTFTPDVENGTPEDIPTCSEDLSLEEQKTCFLDAVDTSELLVRSLVDELLALESDTGRRIAFFEAQFAWEESRDADCLYVRGSAAEPAQGEVLELKCLLERNLARLEQLEQYHCEWYEPSGCEDEVSTLE